MDYGLQEEQTMLQDMVHKYFSKECPRALVRELLTSELGYAPAMWKGMAELGLVGITISEEFGGIGGNFLDLCLILEEMGAALVPSPFFATTVLSAPLVEWAAEVPMKEAFLPSCAGGDLIASLAWLPKSGRAYPGNLGITVQKDRDGFVLSGQAWFVPFAHVSDRLVCAGRHEDGEEPGTVTLFLLDPKNEKCRLDPTPSISPDRPSRVRLSGYAVPAEQVIGEVTQGWTYLERLWPQLVTAKCAELTGIFRQMLNMTVDHVNERRQFGRPLAALQAIQHFCADMAIDIETSRVTSYQAAWRIAMDLPARKEAAMAKAWCNDVVTRIIRMSHQAHGAIGFTEEYDLQLFTKRAKACQLMYGDVDMHHEVVAQTLGL